MCDYQALLLRVNIWKFPLVEPGPEKKPLGGLSKVLLNLVPLVLFHTGQPSPITFFPRVRSSLRPWVC